MSNLTASVSPIVNSDIATESNPVVFEVKAPSNAELIELIAEKNGVNTALALAIAKCESEHRQFNEDGRVLRGRENPQDVGLFQINEFYHLEDSKKLGYDIYTAKGNVDYAMHIMKRDGIRHWTYSKPCWGNKVASHHVALK